MVYHVSVLGNDSFSGTEEAPFRTINRAAGIAVAGDTVLVHDGTYREWVDPQNGGINHICRITYAAAPGAHPVIKGSEVITDWEHVEGTIWKKKLSNALFGDWNPYRETVNGDWLVLPDTYSIHLGDVYINGVSAFEASSMEDLYTAAPRISMFRHPQNAALVEETILNPELTVYRWMALVDEENTTILCNFQELDPNQNLIEINVRKCCFYPCRAGLNYITVRGFEMAHAACPFTPPTADQPAMLGTHWSRGWIIEENHLHDAKCSAVSIGKDAQTGHNLYSRFDRKPGYQYQQEAMFLALHNGWSRESIGSHVIRNNVIHDCGQNGIVGHLGCVFCRIHDNHIYNVAVKQEFWGHEIGGIKLHAPIDTVIEHNLIHNCSFGIWLDWEAQGTRITRNILTDNNYDLKIEVTHGPCTVDNNLLLSPCSIDNTAQGSAYVHNLIGGILRLKTVLDRSTPYHFPHSTQVAGFSVTFGGDDRWFGNLFLGTNDITREGSGHYWLESVGCGTEIYRRHSPYAEYRRLIAAEGNADNAKYFKIPQAVWINGNAYFGFAKPYRAEEDFVCGGTATVDVIHADKQWKLHLRLPVEQAFLQRDTITAEELGAPRITEASFENPDGTPIAFATDLLGVTRESRSCIGPFAKLLSGETVIWEEI